MSGLLQPCHESPDRLLHPCERLRAVMPRIAPTIRLDDQGACGKGKPVVNRGYGGYTLCGRHSCVRRVMASGQVPSCLEPILNRGLPQEIFDGSTAAACVDARHAHAALSVRMNKCDPNAARATDQGGMLS